MKKIGLILFFVCGMVCLTALAMAEDAATPVAAPEAAAAGGNEETDIIAGKVAAVDAANSTLTVTDEAGKSYTITATKEETSIWKGDDTIELAEVKNEDSVELEYYKGKDGKLVAIWVDILTKEATMPMEAKPEAAAPAPAAAPETAPMSAATVQ